MSISISILVGASVFFTLVGIFANKALSDARQSRQSALSNAKLASRSAGCVNNVILRNSDIYIISALADDRKPVQSSVEIVIRVNGEPVASKGYIVNTNLHGRSSIAVAYDHSDV